MKDFPFMETVLGCRMREGARLAEFFFIRGTFKRKCKETWEDLSFP